MKFDLLSQPPLPFHTASLYAAQVLAASAGPWPGVVEHRDQKFGPESWQGYDVFAPESNRTGLDVLVFLHGGGWTNGYKEWCGFMAPGVTSQSCLLVAPSYNLAPAVRYPALVVDVISTLREIRAAIGVFGGNPDRIFIAGHSAGGHIAAQIALRPDLCAGQGLAVGVLKACLSISGILDLREASPQPGSMEARVYDLVLEEAGQDWQASPLAWSDNINMPMDFTWGAADSARVKASNEAMQMALSGSDIPIGFHVEDTDHFGTHLGLMDTSHRWYRELAILRKDTE